MLHLVLGGARSGKSSFAESFLLDQVKQAKQSKQDNAMPIYIATAQALDNEMTERIKHHQQQRSNEKWQLIECPQLLVEQLQKIDNHALVLIDCLTLWLTNHLMIAEQQLSVLPVEDYLSEQVDRLVATLDNHQATIVIVANEIGLGVVPMGKATRIFVDHAGWLNQKLAAIAQRVTLVTAGLPMILKDDIQATAEQGRFEGRGQGKHHG